MKNYLKYLYNLGIFSIFFVIFISSALNIFEKRGKILAQLDNSNYKGKLTKKLKNKEWSEKILKGGYILVFRHAERDKWIDVQMYDAIESDLHDKGINQSRLAEKDYYSDAVCLNSRGKIQAKAMSEVINYSKLPIGRVVSSPSCRARQTAELAFGGYDDLNRDLVHKGPYYEDMKKRNIFLKNYLLNLPIEKGLNTIVSAHNSVMHKDMFINNNDPDLFLEEGGFYVISKKDGDLILEHEFHFFKEYSSNFFERKY